MRYLYIQEIVTTYVRAELDSVCLDWVFMPTHSRFVRSLDGLFSRRLISCDAPRHLAVALPEMEIMAGTEDRSVPGVKEG
jgi:hypothetical protein